MNLLSEFTAGQALALLIQSAIVLTIGILAARLLRSKGPAWTTAIFRATLATVFVAAAATPFLKPSAHPVVAITPPARGPEIKWPLATPTKPTAFHRPAEVQTATPVRVMPPLTDPTIASLPAVTDSSALSVRDALLLLWIIGSAALLGWMVFGQIWLWSHRRRTSVPNSLSTLLRQLAARFGIPAPALVVSPQINSPFVAGIFRPAIYIPKNFQDQFDAQDVEAILSHELVHIRHQDCFWNLIAKLVCAVAWPNPIVWWVARQMTLASEELCDQTVLQQGFKAKSYANCLMRIAEVTTATRIERCGGVGIIEFRSTLGRRVARVLDPSSGSLSLLSRRARFGTVGMMSLTAVATCFLVSAHRSAAPHQAGAALPPSDPAAKAYLQTCVAAYGNLKEFQARVTLMQGQFQSTTFDVSYRRPDQVLINLYDQRRLAVAAQLFGVKDRFYTTSPNHPKEYVAHERPASDATHRYGDFPWYRDHSTLEAALQSMFIDFGFAEAALEPTDFQLRGMTAGSVTFGPDQRADGRLVRTVVIQSSGGVGSQAATFITAIEIDDSNRLVRKEIRTTRVPHQNDNVTTEIYSDVRTNSPMANIAFNPPPSWKRIPAQDGPRIQSPAAQALVSQLENTLRNAKSISFVDDVYRHDGNPKGAGGPRRLAQHARLTVEIEKPLKAHIKIALDEYPNQNMELVSDGQDTYIIEGQAPRKYLKVPASPESISGMGSMGIPMNTGDSGLEMVGVALRLRREGYFGGEVGKPIVLLQHPNGNLREAMSNTTTEVPVDQLVQKWGRRDQNGFPVPRGVGSNTFLISQKDHLLQEAINKMGDLDSITTVTETFSNFHIDAPIAEREFAFNSNGMAAAETPRQAQSYPPDPNPGFNPQLGDVLPDFHSTDLAGNPISLDQFRGKVVLLHAWTFGIGNYEWDLPHYKRLAEKYGKRGLVVIGIPYEDAQDKPQVVKFLRSQGITTPQVFDGLGRSGGIQKEYKKLGTMFDYVIDRKGRLYAKDPWNKDVDIAVEEALRR
jgi:beta-lactamase regulating signal transducer with metallopeptidase domain/peroxiredoxin